MKKKVIIIGAGLCGTLLAIRLGQRGYPVQLYEKRGDLRKTGVEAGRSINLALSDRGLMALKQAGLADAVREYCIPMHGRMIHPIGKPSFLSPYSGRDTDYINSVSRSGLNIALLEAADEMDHVNIAFNHKCKHIDLGDSRAHLTDLDSGKSFTDEGSIVIGTDGAGSAVRRSMMGQTTRLRFHYEQSFLEHGYKELHIPPGKNGSYQIEKNALHIWPRDQFMIIALPNLDGSFTVTMFHPYGGAEGLDALKTKVAVQAFFEKYFADLIPFMPDYLDDFFDNPTGTLGTIRCSPWQADGRTLVMGDAAHAIVPFYGQGMNASFEDVRVFDDILDQHEGDWETIFKHFQKARIPNANAIADLALDNFYEMQDKVNDEIFIKKRNLERQLEQTFPDYYSKYSLVTFQPELSYEQAMKRGRWQDQFLMEVCKTEENPALEEVMEHIRKGSESLSVSLFS